MGFSEEVLQRGFMEVLCRGLKLSTRAQGTRPLVMAAREERQHCADCRSGELGCTEQVATDELVASGRGERFSAND